MKCQISTCNVSLDTTAHLAATFCYYQLIRGGTFILFLPKNKAILDITNKLYGRSLFQFTEMGSSVNRISFKLICSLTYKPQSGKMGIVQMYNFHLQHTQMRCETRSFGFVNDAKINFWSVYFEGSIHGYFEISAIYCK